MAVHSPLEDRIVVDPDILVGKPTIRGTRISVELVLTHLAQNPDVGDLLAAYPHITVEDVKARLAYAEAVIRGEDVFPAAAPDTVARQIRARRQPLDL